VAEIEAEGLRYVYQNDPTASFVDARSPAEFEAGSQMGARNAFLNVSYFAGLYEALDSVVAP